jgi:hypothetical protein
MSKSKQVSLIDFRREKSVAVFRFQNEQLTCTDTEECTFAGLRVQVTDQMGHTSRCTYVNNTEKTVVGSENRMESLNTRVANKGASRRKRRQRISESLYSSQKL